MLSLCRQATARPAPPAPGPVPRCRQCQAAVLSCALDDFRSSWVSMDADDSDARRWWSYVIAGLETVYPATGTAAVALLRLPQLPPMDAIVTSLINATQALLRASELKLL
jgi:ATP/maltotriose-dependent transcriptional regulator MalT